MKQGIYLVNSVNPFRLEGQKTIMFRVLESLGWNVPDWIVVPGGNLGNSSAFGKAFHELHELGLIDRLPRLAVINAVGASTLYELVERRGLRWNAGRPNASIINNYYAELDDTGRRASTIASTFYTVLYGADADELTYLPGLVMGVAPDSSRSIYSLRTCWQYLGREINRRARLGQCGQFALDDASLNPHVRHCIENALNPGDEYFGPHF